MESLDPSDYTDHRMLFIQAFAALAASLTLFSSPNANATPMTIPDKDSLVIYNFGPKCEVNAYPPGVLLEVCDYPIDPNGDWKRCRTFTSGDKEDHECYTVHGKDMLPGEQPHLSGSRKNRG